MRLVSTALFVLLFPAIGAAQNHGIFIQAGPLADFLFTANTNGLPVDVSPLSSSSQAYTWIDLNGDRRWQPGEEGSPVSGSVFGGVLAGEPRTSKSRAAAGASAALGVFITPSVSLRIEGSYQGEQVTQTDTEYVSQFFTIEDRHSTSTTDIFVAAGWHQGESRATMTYLAGMVFRRQNNATSLRYAVSSRLPPMMGLGQTVAGTDSILQDGFETTNYAAGVMTGVDVTIRLSEHLAVVPQVRLVAANRALSLRPAVSMRWQP
jgi:hypothetical protein